MPIIPQKELFVWSEIDDLGDLERLVLVLESLPDEQLMRKLEEKRGPSGINKYPIRAVWNSIIALIVFGHPTIESLRRELKRNPALRQQCGFSVFVGSEAVQSAGCYSRFFQKLMKYEKEVKKIFYELLRICYEKLDRFGTTLGIDGKALSSYARKNGRHPEDHRGDHEANWGKHVSRSEGKDGTVREKTKTWFGYTLHLIADLQYELPIEWTVLPAAANEMPVAHKLIDRMGAQYPERLENCEYLCGDRGYDDGKLHVKLYDEYGIKPIIDIKRSWKDGEETKAFEKVPGVVYSNKGEVFCISQRYGDQKKMACRGFEGSRKSVKYRCPAEHYGITCRGKDACQIPSQVRIPLEEDRRIFSPVPRDSYKWEKIYTSRSAIERVNSRIDRMFGFEEHTIRGLDKMNLRIGLSFIVMLAFAVGRIRQKKPEEIRRFFRSA